MPRSNRFVVRSNSVPFGRDETRPSPVRLDLWRLDVADRSGIANLCVGRKTRFACNCQILPTLRVAIEDVSGNTIDRYQALNCPYVVILSEECGCPVTGTQKISVFFDAVVVFHCVRCRPRLLERCSCWPHLFRHGFITEKENESTAT